MVPRMGGTAAAQGDPAHVGHRVRRPLRHALLARAPPDADIRSDVLPLRQHPEAHVPLAGVWPCAPALLVLHLAEFRGLRQDGAHGPCHRCQDRALVH